MNKTQLDKINKINTQIAELREQLDQIWVDLNAEYNERAAPRSPDEFKSEAQEELITTYLENTTTCLVHAEDMITMINQAYYGDDK